MSDIFISYARENRPQAERIAEALARDWSVWWDPIIPAGQIFRKVIREEIDKARCMVVLWSSTSVESAWVLDEASLGKRRGILVPVRIEAVEPPLGFGEVHTADLTGWNGDTSAQDFRRLCQDLTALLGPGSGLEPQKAPAQPMRSFVAESRQAAPKLPGRRWVLGLAVLAALVAASLVYKLSVRGGAVPATSEHPARVDRTQPATVAHRQPGAHTTLKDGLSYVWIAPGEFMMGALPGDSDAGPEEKPRHRVRITRGFWLGETAVTVAAYKRFVKEQTKGKMPDAPSFNRGWTNEHHPVVMVTWDEAQAYCAWAGGTGGRLPTEAQWEYAARGGKSGLKYPWGNEITSENANYHGSKWEGTSPVRFYPPNAWGLYDMAGNIWEWMADWYDEDYYAAQPPGKPVDDPQGPDRRTGDRVLRGGSFVRGPIDLRASGRGKRTPVAMDHSVGFRCVTDVAP